MKSVIDKLKYELVLPPVMLMAVMAMEGEPRDTECKLHLINDAVIWNACPKVHFHLWWLREGSVKNNKVELCLGLMELRLHWRGSRMVFKVLIKICTVKAMVQKLSFHSVL